MAREKFDFVTKKWMPVEKYEAMAASRRDQVARSELPAPMMVRDIEPYQSVITGEMITSRSKHREHLHRHGAIEMGHEKPKVAPRKTSDAEKRTRREQIKASARTHGVDVV